MEIIKEIELPTFDLKIKLFEEFNKYYYKKYQYFNIYIDNKKNFNNRTKSYKYFSIDIEDVAIDILYPIYLTLNQKLEEKNDDYFACSAASTLENTIRIGNAKKVFNVNLIKTSIEKQTIKDFVNCIRESIFILLEQWKNLNITNPNEIGEF